MIVNTGKDVIRQFFGGQTRQIGGAIALGTGTTAPALGNTSLVAEVYRINVTSVSADLANNRIVFKAVVPAGIATLPTINEIGLIYTADDAIVGTLVARLVLTTPKVIDNTIPTEIEYSLRITV